MLQWRLCPAKQMTAAQSAGASPGAQQAFRTLCRDCSDRRSLTKLLRGRWKVQLPRSWGGYFRNDYDHRDFVSIGAAAGPAIIQPPKPCDHKDFVSIGAGPRFAYDPLAACNLQH